VKRIMEESIRERKAAAGDPRIADRLREAIRQQPGRMTLQLAREFGVPEVEVVRAFPDDRAAELDPTRWEDLIRRFEPLGPVRVLVSNGATTMEGVGQFGGFSTTDEFFNVQTESLDLHIRWQELTAAFAVEKPGHMDGQATYSFQFFDRRGHAAFKVFLNFGDPLAPKRRHLFLQIRHEFEATRGRAGA
jgi:putative heme iron utilization protein